jgi:sugar (pentulose or hexulose) kinase
VKIAGMTNAPSLLAIDLGAESGRAMLGRFDGSRIEVAELHRFVNEPVRLPSGLHWDAPRLFREIVRSLEFASGQGIELAGIAVDSWGLDFGLLDGNGALLGLPFHYRDDHVNGMLAVARSRIDDARLYELTGCRIAPLNTLFQLLAMEGSPALERAETMLLTPDLMSYWLSGEQAAERTIASTTELYDPRSGSWSHGVIQSLGFARHIFPEIQPPGTIRGSLRSILAEESGAPAGLPVIATAAHDTASAFVSVTSGPGSLVVSSGTWSLTGIETDEPIITPEAMAANFTNEAGVGGTNRFLRNAAGMWLVQESRRTWAKRGRQFSYDDLTALAELADPFGPVIDPDDPVFLAPGDMPGRIQDYCIASGQRPPQTEGEVVRCILESLVLTYRSLAENIARLSGRTIESIHIIGGGSRNGLHCQLAAGATGLPVLAGPVEATAIGNLMVQALALGAVATLTDIREVVGRSFQHIRYEPHSGDRSAWDAAYARYLALASRSLDRR